MAKKRRKGKARLTAQPAEESVVDLSPTDCIAETAMEPLKVCRLCANKDGPFLSIFEPDLETAQKIEKLMPFQVAKNDELPHKICYRCSAKLEELHDFIQKCIRTQILLQTALGKEKPYILKLKMDRSLWEKNLNKSNISNDDICDAIIKKAMEGIKNIPVNPSPLGDKKNTVKPGNETVNKKAPEISKVTEISNEIIDIESDDNTGHESEVIENPARMSRKKLTISKECVTPKRITRSSSASRALRSNTEYIGNVATLQSSDKLKPTATRRRSSVDSCAKINGEKYQKKKKTSDTMFFSDNKKIKIEEVEKNETNSNGTAKKFIEKVMEQESTQKDINKKSKSDQKKSEDTPKVNAETQANEKHFDIMDHVSMIKVNGVGFLFQCTLCNRNFLKKEVVQSHSCAKNRCVPKEDIVRKQTPPEPPKPPTVKYINTTLGNDSKKFDIPETCNSSDKTNSDITTLAVTEGKKSKPRIGPASKVKREQRDSETPTKINPFREHHETKISCGTASLTPTGKTQEHDTKTQKLSKKDHESLNAFEQKRKRRQSVIDCNYMAVGNSNSLPSESDQTEATKLVLHKQPYPVGLVQTVPKVPSKTPTTDTTGSMIFTTTAAQRQSYSIIQTDHPRKLLISAKPQHRAEEPVTKLRKTKPAPRTQQTAEAAKPFSVTLGNTSRHLDPETFSVLNIDPLLTPSYVLPIPHETQPVTTNNDRTNTIAHLSAGSSGYYACNMCNEVFTREQKLIAHIHSHYNRMDEEDKVSKTVRKRGRKS